MQINHAIHLTVATCELKHLSISTQKCYVHWLRRYARFLQDVKQPIPSTELKIEAFLTRLASTHIAASTQNQAFNALLFFYREALKQPLGPISALRAKRPATIRDCPSQTEVFQLLSAVPDVHHYPTRLIVHLLYACGLRVTDINRKAGLLGGLDGRALVIRRNVSSALAPGPTKSAFLPST